MALVIILIILGIFLLGVEVFLLPGITVAGIGALISCGFGIYEAFVKYGNAGGFIALAAVLVLSVIMLAMGLRAKTWKRLALHNNIDGASQPSPEKEHIAALSGVVGVGWEAHCAIPLASYPNLSNRSCGHE